MEDDMQTLLLLAQAGGWFGIFLAGVAAIWFVSIYARKQ
jgi:hypothetical protein